MNAFQELRTYLRSIEKRVLYVFLFFFMFIQWLAILFPQLGTYFSMQVNTALFSMFVLAIFRLLDCRLGEPSIQPHSRNFAQAIDALFKKRRSFESLDLFAHTSSKYYSAVRNKDVHIKRVRILLISDECVLNAPTPKGEKDKETVQQEKSVIIKKWKDMKKEGRIDKLTIKECDFMSYFHFSIVDQETAVLGFFRPTESGPGVTTLSLRTINNHNTQGGELIRDLAAFYDTLFDKYSNFL